MRLIDADALERVLCARAAQCSNDYGSLAGAISGCLKLVRAQPTIAPPPNPPLTLEELLEMDGEPVWCVLNIEAVVDGKAMQLTHKGEWGIVGYVGREDGFIIGTAFMYYLDSYGKSWLAYRRKPENEKTERCAICAATGVPCSMCQPGPCESRR